GIGEMPGDDGANSAGRSGDDHHLVVKTPIHPSVRPDLEHDADAARRPQPFAAEQATLFPDLEALAVDRQPVIAGPEIKISGAVLRSQRLKNAAHFDFVFGPAADPNVA